MVRLYDNRIPEINHERKSHSKKACWKAEELMGWWSVEGCYQIVHYKKKPECCGKTEEQLEEENQGGHGQEWAEEQQQEK